MSQLRESVWWGRVLFATWLVFAITGWTQTTVLQPRILLTVTKSAGPTELSSSDIDLKEDGRTPHTVSVVKSRNLPLRVGIVIDESGSGRRAGLHGVIIQRTLDSAADWLQAHGGDGFLVGFNDQIIISTELVTDVAHLRNVMGQLRPIGGSAIRDAVVHAGQKFFSVAPEPKPSIRVILLVSDGYDNASNASEQRAVETAQREGVRVYPISFPSPEAAAGRHLLENIARHTGGQAFFPLTDKELATALKAIDDELSNSFLVSFASETRDGKFHSVKIRVRGVDGQGLRFMPAFASVKP